jgi:hypothetical protein
MTLQLYNARSVLIIPEASLLGGKSDWAFAMKGVHPFRVCCTGQGGGYLKAA